MNWGLMTHSPSLSADWCGYFQCIFRSASAHDDTPGRGLPPPPLWVGPGRLTYMGVGGKCTHQHEPIAHAGPNLIACWATRH
jgi:hypothetical protein